MGKSLLAAPDPFWEILIWNECVSIVLLSSTVCVFSS